MLSIVAVVAIAVLAGPARAEASSQAVVIPLVFSFDTTHPCTGQAATVTVDGTLTIRETTDESGGTHRHLTLFADMWDTEGFVGSTTRSGTEISTSGGVIVSAIAVNDLVRNPTTQQVVQGTGLWQLHVAVDGHVKVDRVGSEGRCVGKPS